MDRDSQRAATVKLSRQSLPQESDATVETPAPDFDAPPSAPAAAPVDDDPLVGVVVGGRYRVLSKLGQGGMGAVYRVEHAGLKKLYALKVMRLQSSDPESVARFEREALASAHLEHKNVARCIDVGELDNNAGRYLVMELVDGEPLAKLIEREGSLAPAKALAILSQVASALTCAHGKDIVHRDLKPDNIIVGRDGTVKLIDFGIARARSQSLGGGGTALTKAGTMLGTPTYMSPEQVVGQAVDGRADQYAFGVIAFELFTGKPPFEAEDPLALVFKHVGEDVPRASQRQPSLPVAIDAVFDRVLAKTPAARFDSVQQAHDALAGAFSRPSSAALAVAPSGSYGAPIQSSPALSAAAVPSMTAIPAPIHSFAMVAQAPPSKPADRRALFAAIALLALVLTAGAAFVAGTGHRDAGTDPSIQGAAHDSHDPHGEPTAEDLAHQSARDEHERRRERERREDDRDREREREREGRGHGKNKSRGGRWWSPF
ncbi:MAG: serine/threonine protein kinase [Myxococcales bacterium]|nr:serine/threonine protein kinase [Myxococcales bacterium]